MKTDNTQLVDAKTLAEIMNLPPTSVRRYARSGKLPCYKIGRLLRFDPEEVKVALKGQHDNSTGSLRGNV